MMYPAIREITQLDQWVISKPVQARDKAGNLISNDDGSPKLDKPPFSPHTGYQCSHSKPAAWSSYQDAQAARARYNFPWLGFVFHQADPYSGIDLDGCVRAGVERIATLDDLEPWARRIVDLVHSYTEVSPSGLGVKIFVRGTLAKQLAYSMGVHKGIEIYSALRFFTVTGAHLAGTPTEICEAQDALDQLQAEYKPAPSDGQRKPTQTAQTHRTAPAATGQAGRYSAAETIAAANDANDLGAYLESQGAHLVRTAGDTRYYSGLAGDMHTHQITYVVSPAEHGRGHSGTSYSPNGRLNKTEYPRGFRFFDAYCAIEHGGDRIAALKALTPGRPAPSAGQCQLAHQVEPPAVSPIERHRRAAENQRKQLQRQQAAAARLASAGQLDQAASTDRRIYPFARAVLAYHVSCWAAAAAPEHYASVERIARAVFALDQAPTENQVRRLQLAHERLIERGYLVRTVRYTPGEAKTNCWQPPADGGMVIRNCAADADEITMLESSTESHDKTLRVCEGGRAAQPDSPPPAETAIAKRELLSQVRHLAREVAEPLWMLRDYDEWSAAQLQAEAERLQAVLDQAAAAAAPVEPPAVRVVDTAPQFNLATPETRPEPADGASYPHPIEPSGEYTGRAKHDISDRVRLAWANETIRVIDAPAEVHEVEQAQISVPPVLRPATRGTVSASDRYRADVALMDEYRLAGEIKKHTATLKKHAGAMWLDQVRAKLAIVQAEIDERAGGAVARSASQLQGGTAPIGRARAHIRPPSQTQLRPRAGRSRGGSATRPLEVQSLDMFAGAGVTHS